MGLLGQMMAGGVANAAAGLGDSLEMREKLDAQARLQQSERLFQQHLAELKHGWDTEATAAQRKYEAGQKVIGRTDKGLLATRADMDAGVPLMSEEEYSSTVPMSPEKKAEHDARMALLGVQTKGAEAALLSKEDRRGDLGKKYDDLVRAYGPEKGAAMFEQLLVKGDRVPMSDAQRTSSYNAAYKEYLADNDAQTPVPTGKTTKKPGLLWDKEEPELKRKSFQEWLQDNRPDLIETEKTGGGTGGGAARNNVGGMRPVGQSTGFQSFESVEESLKAVDNNLKTYGSKHGVNTLEGVISRWSPPNENDTQKLIENASRVTGFKPDQEIDLGNPAVRAVLAAAIIRQEGNSAFLDGAGGGGGGKSSSTGQSGPVPGGKKPDPAQFAVGAKQQQQAPAAQGASSGGDFQASADIGVSSMDDSVPTQRRSPFAATGLLARQAVDGVQSLGRGAQDAKNAVVAGLDNKTDRFIAAGEKIGQPAEWVKALASLKGSAKESYEALKQAGFPDEKIAEAAQQSGFPLEEFLRAAASEFSKGYNSK